MSRVLAALAALAALAWVPRAHAELVFFEHEGFKGRSFTTVNSVGELQRQGYEGRASSAVIGSDRWEVCEGARFQGRCAVLVPGRYTSPVTMGLSAPVASARMLSRTLRPDAGRP